MRKPHRWAPLLAAGLITAGLATAAPATSAPAPVLADGDIGDGVTHAENPLVPEGASWSEHYFPSEQAGSPTPVELHADVLRPADLPVDAKTPVIVSIGPYFSHAGQTGTDTTETGPSVRFNDLFEGADVFAKGYTVVLVDLRGYGGSTGCIDWLGNGEQADSKAAVEWAASQPWSTGKVGTYGKSYDASTGLLANNEAPKGLAAVVAQEPLWNPYNYYYSNGIKRYNYVATPNAYASIATIPPTPGDTDRYKANAAYEAQHPECVANNAAVGLVDDQSDPVWQERDTVAPAAGTKTPIFFTQGLTESNTKPEDMQRYLAAHTGPEQGWLGPWEHVRGNDLVGDQLAMGRSGWFDEVMRFYDRYLKGVTPSVADPAYAIQNSNGVWRGQRAWPTYSAAGVVALGGGSYLDNGNNPLGRSVSRTGDMDRIVRTTKAKGSGSKAVDTSGNYFVFSKPVAQATRLTSTPNVTIRSKGTGTVMVRLFDVDPATGEAVMINENVSVLTGGQTTFELKSHDWDLAPGHVLGVSVGTATNTEYWIPDNSLGTIKVQSVRLSLATAATTGDRVIEGAKSAFLDSYKSANGVNLGAVPGGRFVLPKPKS